MASSLTFQVIVLTLSKVIPFALLVVMIWLKIVPPSLATVCGFLLLILVRKAGEMLQDYGFSESAYHKSNYIFILLMIVYIYFIYKLIKKHEERSEDKELN